MIRLDSQLDDLVWPLYVQVLNGKVLKGSSVVLVLVFAEQHGLEVLFVLQPLKNGQDLSMSTKRGLRNSYPNSEIAGSRVYPPCRRKALGYVLQSKSRHIHQGVQLKHCTKGILSKIIFKNIVWGLA